MECFAIYYLTFELKCSPNDAFYTSNEFVYTFSIFIRFGGIIILTILSSCSLFMRLNQYLDSCGVEGFVLREFDDEKLVFIFGKGGNFRDVVLSLFIDDPLVLFLDEPLPPSSLHISLLLLLELLSVLSTLRRPLYSWSILLATLFTLCDLVIAKGSSNSWLACDVSCDVPRVMSNSKFSLLSWTLTLASSLDLFTDLCFLLNNWPINFDFFESLDFESSSLNKVPSMAAGFGSFFFSLLLLAFCADCWWIGERRIYKFWCSVLVKCAIDYE